MNNEKFFTWCRVAVKKIKYRPDRDAVHKELYEHLEDRYESFRSRGWEHEEAIDKSIEAMGSAEDLAPQLAKIHSPFWRYMLRVSRVLLIFAIVISLIPCWVFILMCVSQDTSYSDKVLLFKPDNRDEIIWQWKPECTQTVDCYKFTVTEATLWDISIFREDFRRECFVIRIEITNLTPWAAPIDVVYKFSIKDNLGNVYLYGDDEIDRPRYASRCKETGEFVSVCEIVLDNFVSHDADWIDFGIAGEGRNLLLRVHLRGGEKIEATE